MKTAKFIKQLDGFRGYAALYELSEPVTYESMDGEEFTTDFVVVSAVSVFDVVYPVSETFAFPAMQTGKVINYLELEGSERGTCSHKTVLENMGYSLLPDADENTDDSDDIE